MAFALAAGSARNWLAAGLLLGTLPHLHHLTALIAWSSAGVLALVFRSRAIFKSLAVAALVALPLVPAVLGAMGGAGSTSILHFADEPRRSALEYVWSAHHWGWGPALLALAAVGIARGPRPRGALAVLGFLVAMHVGLDVVYRAIALHVTGEDFSALTPSRWFQLASIPLALFAGIGVRALARGRALIGAIAILILAAPFARWEYVEPHLDAELFSVAAWAREKLPEDAFVIVRARDLGEKNPKLLPARYWWPYLLRRETDATPLPASEPRRDPRVLSKRTLAADPAAARAYAASRKKKLFWLRPSSMPPELGVRRFTEYHGLVVLDED
jgi:hypothetical protein